MPTRAQNTRPRSPLVPDRATAEGVGIGEGGVARGVEASPPGAGARAGARPRPRAGARAGARAGRRGHVVGAG